MVSCAARHLALSFALAASSRGMRRGLFSFVLAVLLVAGASASASAQATQLVREPELENAIRTYLYALNYRAQVAQVLPSIRIVNTGEANAFTDGSDAIYFTVGFWRAASTVDSALAVTAHEIGHVVGGHVASTVLDSEIGLVATGLSLAVTLPLALVSGNAYVLLGSAGLASTSTGLVLSQVRLREQIADDYAIELMLAAGYDPEGLETFLRAVDTTIGTSAQSGNVWYRTHPFSVDRVAYVQQRRRGEAVVAARRLVSDDELMRVHQRAVAKATAMLFPRDILDYYPDALQGTDAIARYAYISAATIDSSLDTVLAQSMAVELLTDWPDDPFLLGMAGQLAVTNGLARDGMDYLARAIDQQPFEGYWRVAYGFAALQFVTEFPDAAQDVAVEALTVLAPVHRDSPVLIELYRIEASLYNLLGAAGEENLALARLFRSRGQNARALTYYDLALGALDEESVHRILAEDEAFALKAR